MSRTLMALPHLQPQIFSDISYFTAFRPSATITSSQDHCLTTMKQVTKICKYTSSLSSSKDNPSAITTFFMNNHLYNTFTHCHFSGSAWPRPTLGFIKPGVLLSTTFFTHSKYWGKRLRCQHWHKGKFIQINTLEILGFGAILVPISSWALLLNSVFF